MANPANAATDSLLRVDAGFISGVAANVALAPKDATVVIVPAPLAPGTGAKDAAASRGSFSISTTGSPSQRIGTAIAPSHYGTDMNTERINNWINSNPKENRRRLHKWMDDNGYENQGITNILYAGEFAGARERIVLDLYIH